MDPAVDTTPVASSTPAPDPNAAPDVTLPATPSMDSVLPAGVASTMPSPPPESTSTQPASGFKASFRQATAAPSYHYDDNGNLINDNPAPTKTGFTGLLGGIVGGALRGAEEGLAAEKSESGAAAAQRISQATDNKAREIAQRNAEQKRVTEDRLLQHNLINLQMVNLIRKSNWEEEEHAQMKQSWGLQNQEIAQRMEANDTAQRMTLADLNAKLNLAGVEPLHTLNKTDGTAPTGTAKDINNPEIKKSILGQATIHATGIANGTLTMVQNGGRGASNGAFLYKTSDLQNPVTQPFYYKVATGLTNQDGSPNLEDRVIQPDGKTTYMDVLARINAANAQVDTATKKLGADEQARKAKLEEGKITAETREANSKANLAGTQAKQINDIAKLGQQPVGYKIPDGALTMSPADLAKQISAQGGTPPSNLGALQSTARYDGNIDVFPTRTYKGDPHMTRADAEDYIVKNLNPAFKMSEYAARANYMKEFEGTKAGAGATRDRLNTAIGHLDLLGSAATAVSQNNIQLLNSLANKYGTQTGQDPEIVYKGIAAKAAGELAGAIKGGSGSATDQEITSALQSFNPNLAPQQQASNIRTQMQILQTAHKTLYNHFVDSMGQQPEALGHHVLSTENQQALNKWVGSGTTPTGNATNPNAPGAPNSAGNPTGIAKKFLQDNGYLH